jgi:CRISPR/Cas system-associated exonuclease Cas4 (RecB family)
MALMRGDELAFKACEGGANPSVSSMKAPRSNREEWFYAAKGRLVGKPDLVEDEIIVDFKTGNVYEYGDADVVKGIYVRQLQFYAYLVEERTGRWPVRGVLFPMDAPPVEVNLNAEECQRNAVEALEMLESYNGQIATAGNASDLAKPSPETCKWCEYQIVCPAFWQVSDGSWGSRLGAAAVGGLATTMPRPIYEGAAFSISVRLDQGSEAHGVIDLSPVRPEMHPAIRTIVENTRIRVVGLHRRGDSTLLPGQLTVIAVASHLPKVALLRKG